MYKLINITPPKDNDPYSCYEADAIYEDGYQMHVTFTRADYAKYIFKSKLNELGVLNQVSKELAEMIDLIYEEGANSVYLD